MYPLSKPGSGNTEGAAQVSVVRFHRRQKDMESLHNNAMLQTRTGSQKGCLLHSSQGSFCQVFPDRDCQLRESEYTQDFQVSFAVSPARFLEECSPFPTCSWLLRSISRGRAAHLRLPLLHTLVSDISSTNDERRAVELYRKLASNLAPFEMRASYSFQHSSGRLMKSCIGVPDVVRRVRHVLKLGQQLVEVLLSVNITRNIAALPCCSLKEGQPRCVTFHSESEQNWWVERKDARRFQWWC